MSPLPSGVNQCLPCPLEAAAPHRLQSEVGTRNLQTPGALKTSPASLKRMRSTWMADGHAPPHLQLTARGHLSEHQGAKKDSRKGAFRRRPTVLPEHKRLAELPHKRPVQNI